jgi:hypothetical protein
MGTDGERCDSGFGFGIEQRLDLLTRAEDQEHEPVIGAARFLFDCTFREDVYVMPPG